MEGVKGAFVHSELRSRTANKRNAVRLNEKRWSGKHGGCDQRVIDSLLPRWSQLHHHLPTTGTVRWSEKPKQKQQTDGQRNVPAISGIEVVLKWLVSGKQLLSHSSMNWISAWYSTAPLKHSSGVVLCATENTSCGPMSTPSERDGAGSRNLRVKMQGRKFEVDDHGPGVINGRLGHSKSKARSMGARLMGTSMIYKARLDQWSYGR